MFWDSRALLKQISGRSVGAALRVWDATEIFRLNSPRPIILEEVVNELIYDANLGMWLWYDIYKIEKPRISFVSQALKRGFFPYSFNFVFGKRGDTAMCSYCGRFILMHDLTRDHSYPKSLGGIITTTACYECNTKKKNMKPIEWAVWASETGFALRGSTG